MHAQQEPAQAESSAALTTKKNRVAPTSSARRAADASEELIEQEGEEDVDADRAADTAEENVGEVRKRVEKMSYEEAQSKTNDNNNNNDNDNAADESWEKIEKEEMESTKGDGLKRKALDRNDTSFTTVEEDVAAAKRQKDTPSVSFKNYSPLSHSYLLLTNIPPPSQPEKNQPSLPKSLKPAFPHSHPPPPHSLPSKPPPLLLPCKAPPLPQLIATLPPLSLLPCPELGKRRRRNNLLLEILRKAHLLRLGNRHRLLSPLPKMKLDLPPLFLPQRSRHERQP